MIALGASNQLGIPAIDQVVEVVERKVANELLLDLGHLLELVLQRLDEQVGAIESSHVAEAELGEYVPIGLDRSQIIAALVDVGGEFARPLLAFARAVVRDEHATAWLEPLFELRKERLFVFDVQNCVSRVDQVEVVLWELLLCDVADFESHLNKKNKLYVLKN